MRNLLYEFGIVKEDTIPLGIQLMIIRKITKTLMRDVISHQRGLREDVLTKLESGEYDHLYATPTIIRAYYDACVVKEPDEITWLGGKEIRL